MYESNLIADGKVHALVNISSLDLKEDTNMNSNGNNTITIQIPRKVYFVMLDILFFILFLLYKSLSDLKILEIIPEQTIHKTNNIIPIAEP
jgi:type III secretion system FlhB-like substrate exporter